MRTSAERPGLVAWQANHTRIRCKVSSFQDAGTSSSLAPRLRDLMASKTRPGGDTVEFRDEASAGRDVELAEGVDQVRKVLSPR
jgi:hypothetical protein